MTIPVRPTYRPPVADETWYAKRVRLALNKAEREAWDRYTDARCTRCQMVRFHVSHEMDPEHSLEGPEYHADFAHHPFVERPEP